MESVTEFVTSSAAIRAELAALLASREFQSSERLRRFLSYVVEETLKGRGALLKEYSIGIEVFGKDESFDPRIDTIVRVEARKLRAKVAGYYAVENPSAGLRIDLVRGSYAPVFHALREPPEASPEPQEPAPAPAPKSHWWPRLAALFLFGALLALFADLWFRDRPAAAIPSPSIAVLPFADLGEEKNEFFSDGLTDELIDSLGRVPGLHVVGRASAFQLKGTTLNLFQIGRKLKVRTVLEGSIRQSAGRVRITAELDDTSSGYRLWSQTYDREQRDLLTVQRQISSAITATLSGTLRGSQSTSGSAAALGRGSSVSSDAYEDYLKGRYFWNKSTAASVTTALQYFQRAIQKDPDYALPYLGIAACYGALPFHNGVRVREMVPKIRAAALKALELDSGLGEAHLDLAQAAAAEFNWNLAYSEFQKGLELSPGSTLVHRWYSLYLARVGRLNDSLSEARKALELDPVSLYESAAVGTALYRLHRYDEAIEQYRKTLDLDPSFGLAHLGLGLTYLRKDMHAEAVSEVQTAQRHLASDAVTMGKLGYVYGLVGRRAEAQRTLDELMRSSHQGERPPAIYIADVYLGLGDNKAALSWLQRAFDDGDLLPFRDDPEYDSLRSDPGFDKLFRSIAPPGSSQAF